MNGGRRTVLAGFAERLLATGRKCAVRGSVQQAGDV